MESNNPEEIDSNFKENLVYDDGIIPSKNTKNVRNLAGFWILGLCNNYAYVIMLSAAFDLLNPDYHDKGDMEPIVNGTNITTNTTNTTGICNPTSTAAILLADILPSLLIKMIAPFTNINTHVRVTFVIILTSVCFLATSLSVSHWMTFFGVICAALSSGLGEVTFLSYSSYFHKDVVSTWSSGTGGAGVIGALSYTSLTYALPIRHALQVMLIFPVLMGLTFWLLIDHPKPIKCCKLNLCGEELDPILGASIDMSQKPKYQNLRNYSLQQKIALLKPLLKYMIPLGLVYFAEYFINQGLMELLYFPNAASWLDHKKQYRWYQVDYQVGVLISRSSINCLQIKRLWILPILQAGNMVFLLFQTYYMFLPSIWIVLAIIFFEGLLGGSAYVNTFYKISTEIPEEHKELSMGIASLGDSIGIAMAGIIALPVHNALCKVL